MEDGEERNCISKMSTDDNMENDDEEGCDTAINSRKYNFDFYPLSKLKQKQKAQLCFLCLLLNVLIIIVFVLGILYNGKLEEIHMLQKRLLACVSNSTKGHMKSVA